MRATRTITPLVALMFALIAGACASTGGATAVRSNPDLLTREEIMGAESSNLYQVVERLRPRWLRPRANQSFSQLSTDIVVFQGQTMLGTPEVLRQLTPSVAARIRFLDGATAAASLPGLGSRHVGGAIVIDTFVDR